MYKIQEYPLKLEQGKQIVKIPKGGEILSVKHHNHKMRLFAKIKTTEDPVKRTFEIYSTDEVINEYDLEYIDTVPDHNGIMWHIFENR